MIESEWTWKEGENNNILDVLWVASRQSEEAINSSFSRDAPKPITWFAFVILENLICTGMAVSRMYNIIAALLQGEIVYLVKYRLYGLVSWKDHEGVS